jgi:flagella basal body P-ring formation protein FlgA
MQSRRPTPDRSKQRQRLLALGLPLAVAATLAAAAAGARAQVPDALQPALPATLALLEKAARSQLPASARLNLEIGRLDPRLQPAPCQRIEPHLLPGAPAWGRTRVGLRCLRGQVAWNIFLPVHIQVSAPALVATAPVAAGATLGAQHVQIASADWSAGTLSGRAEAPLADATLAQGRVLARPLVPGQPIRASDLQPRQWFAAGDTVEITAVGDGFSVGSQGQALTAGREGQPARVRTDSGRIVSGLPSGERRLEIRL